MKLTHSLLLCGVLLLQVSLQPTSKADDFIYAALSPIEKLDLRYTVKPTDRILQTYTVNTKEATTDDYLLELARTGDINVLADVTDAPTETLPLTVSGTYKLSGLIFLNLLNKRNLTSVRISEDTFLYWPSPDMKQLAQDILARKAANPRPKLPSLDEVETVELLTSYFKEHHKWDGKWEDVDITVPVADLPLELRQRVEAEIYRVGISEQTFDQTPSGALLDPNSEFWAKSHLSLAPGTRIPPVPPGTSRPRVPATPFLYMNRYYSRGSIHTGHGIGEVAALKKDAQQDK
ncbi:MAG: hypothetical protein JWN98_2345 [Abditibacteriota bacterium]|nr:hypothetical protein [Abditibacteriota bacterium]